VILHPDVQQLATVLSKMEALMREYGNEFWAEHLAACRRPIERSDNYGLERFRSLLGGMGSLNDVVLTREGQALTEPNEKLDRLLTEAFELSETLSKP
jgi:hypothetical protein